MPQAQLFLRSAEPPALESNALAIQYNTIFEQYYRACLDRPMLCPTLSFHDSFSVDRRQSMPTSPIIFCDHHPHWQKRAYESLCGTMTIFHGAIYSLPWLISPTPPTPPLPSLSPAYPSFPGLQVDEKSRIRPHWPSRNSSFHP